MSRLFSRTLTLDQAQHLRQSARRVDPNPHIEALERCARIVGAVVMFGLVLTIIMAIDVAIWVPRVHP